MKKVIALLLCIGLFCGMFSGCNSVSEKSDYITKGEFFSLFINKNNLYSDVYSVEEMENSDSYDIEADIMLEWELIDESQKDNLSEATTKELLAQCCVRSMAFRQNCTTEIKDIKKCHDQQAIIDAVGMGIFQLQNGYFDAYEKVTYDDCVEALEKTNEAERNVTYDSELEIEYQDDVEDLNDVEIEDIIFHEEPSAAEPENTSAATESGAQISNLTMDSHDDIKLSMLGSASCKTIEVRIPLFEYNAHPEKFKEGQVCKYNPFQANVFSAGLPNYGYEPFAGVITRVFRDGLSVILILEECTVDRLVKDTPGINKESTTYAVPTPVGYQPELSPEAKEGFSLNKSQSGTGITATFKHTFSLTDPIYEKQKWRNPSAKPSITITATVDNFSITTKNLGKMLLHKAAEASIRLSFDTEISIKAEAGGLRYSPANNGNGKFWSNLTNARWTGASAGGSKEIKLGDVDIPLGQTGIFISCGFYMYVEMDGSIEVSVVQNNAYLCSITRRGRVNIKNLSGQPTPKKAELNATVEAGIHVNPNINFFSVEIVDASAKIGVNLQALAGVYNKEDEALTQGVYATREELDENSNDYSYCIDTTVSLVVEGALLTNKSVIGKFVLSGQKDSVANIGKSWEIFSKHFEDGRYMSSCSRKNRGAVKQNSEGEILLTSYKEHLNKSDAVTLRITSVPVSDKQISNYGGITIVSNDKKVATAKFDAETKTLTIEAVGEGSTEIIIRIKKGKTKKEYYEQAVSVTVGEDYSLRTDLISVCFC